MDYVKAQELVSDLIAKRKRWGNKLSITDFNPDELMDALVIINTEGIRVASEELAKVNRARGASEAREARRKKERDEARFELEKTKAKLADAVLLLKKKDAALNEANIELALRAEQEDG